MYLRKMLHLCKAFVVGLLTLLLGLVALAVVMALSPLILVASFIYVSVQLGDDLLCNGLRGKGRSNGPR